MTCAHLYPPGARTGTPCKLCGFPKCKHHYVRPTNTSDPNWLPVCYKCGENPTASPSQYEKWVGCQRSHGLTMNRDRTQHPSAAYGDRCHDIVEVWGKKGTAPDHGTCEGRTVLSALGYLPAPFVAQHEVVACPVIHGIPWNMRLDIIDGYVPGQWVSFADWKTTGSIRKYAKTAEYLRTEDGQGVVYGLALALAFDVPRVVGRWIYGERCRGVQSPPAGKCVTWTATRDELEAAYAKIRPGALAMLQSRATPPETLPRDVSFCYSFGGCPHWAECSRGLPVLTRDDLARSTLAMIRERQRRKAVECEK